MRLKNGDKVRIKNGASEWMKERGFWIDDWPESIDGMIGSILHDYTNFAGDSSHYEIEIAGVYGCGVNPQWLEVIVEVAK